METLKEKRTDFLFPKRNFFTGLCSVFSLSGETAEFNTSNSGEEADLKALRSDWEMIGQDFRRVLKKDLVK